MSSLTALKEVAIISDIHGQYDALIEALEHWNPDKEHLVFLGDMIDRGPKSKQVLEKVYELKQQYGEQVITIMGNHDKMFIDFLESGYDEVYVRYNGGRATLDSFTNFQRNPETPTIKIIKENYKHLTDMIMNEFEYSRVLGKLLLTHAGFDSMEKDYTKTEAKDFLWIRKHYMVKNRTGYVNVFGHTPVRTILLEQRNPNYLIGDLWVSEDNLYYGIDGGAGSRDGLNIVKFNLDGEFLNKFNIRINKI